MKQLLVGFVTLLLLTTCDAKRTNNKKGSSSHGNSKHHSQPASYGWNAPNQHKPSAPVNEHVSKTSATAVHSGNPSGDHSPVGGSFGTSGYGHNPTNSHPSSHPNTYNHHAVNQSAPIGWNVNNAPKPSAPESHHEFNAGANPAHGYSNPSAYNPGVIDGHHPSSAYNPGVINGHPPPMQPHGYDPMANNHASIPPQTQPQTVIVQSDKPGIGQLIQEAAVHSVVDAGVKSVVNRLIPGGISGHNGEPSAGSAAPASNTVITHNNYYGNGNPVPAADISSASAPAQPSPAQTQGNNETTQQNVTDSSGQNSTNVADVSSASAAPSQLSPVQIQGNNETTQQNVSDSSGQNSTNVGIDLQAQQSSAGLHGEKNGTSPEPLRGSARSYNPITVTIVSMLLLSIF